MSISIIVPIYNGESTIEKTLQSLVNQSLKFDQLLLFNDGSRDASAEIINDFIRKNRLTCAKVINHSKPIGLAATYNEGIEKSKSDLIVTLHQDVILKKNSLEELVKPLVTSDKTIVAAYHQVLHPIKVWQRYNFWQKVFFARMVERTYCGLDGKFDCFRRSALKRVGGFDAKNFRTAGEDGDIINRLSKIGQLVPTKAKIIHLHRDDDKFSAKDIIKKQGQYSEAQGVMLRHWVIKTPRQIFNAFFREFLLIGLLIPYVRFLALALILIYSVYYSKIIFAREYRNPRILILPFLNIFLLFVSAFYSIRGIIFGKQRV